jgi:processive 1,2-diacylglycerol beta-glucosyltransferase
MKILILYAKSGFLGHKVIAENYAELLRNNGYDVAIADVYEIDGKQSVKSGNQIYFWIIKHAPFIWRFLYSSWTSIPGAQWFKNEILPNHFRKTQALVLETKPDAIITTHPSATGVVNYLKDKNLFTGKLFTTFSDWHTQKFWIYPHVDAYLAVIPEHKTDLLKLGFRDDQVAIPGMLVRQAFYSLPEKNTARIQLGIEPSQKVITVMGGGKGWFIENLISDLQTLDATFKVFIVTGSPERQAELEKVIPQNTATSFTVLPFIDPVLYFAASDALISKPGGLTSSEAFLSRLPLLAINPLPGQEDENVKYLTAKNAIVDLSTVGNIGTYLKELFATPEKLASLAENAYAIAPVSSANIILDTLAAKLYDKNRV